MGSGVATCTCDELHPIIGINTINQQGIYASSITWPGL